MDTLRSSKATQSTDNYPKLSVLLKVDMKDDNEKILFVGETFSKTSFISHVTFPAITLKGS